MKKQLNIAGKSIFYRLIGNGNPVMLVHGFGETGDVWREQLAYLKNKFQLIVPDLPGSGQSQMIEDMSIEGMAEVLKLIWDHERSASVSGSAHMGGITIGHSMGGYIVLALAEKYPNYLPAFGLFHSTSFADTEEKKATRRKAIDFIKQHGGFEFLKTSSPNLFSQVSKEELPALIGEFIQSLEDFSGESLIAYYEAMIARPARTDLLKNTKVPVLFIAGTHDNAAPLGDILKQCHLPIRSYFHVLQRSGHMGMIEEPTKSNRLLEEFLNDMFYQQSIIIN